jgi:hypothetical protein
MQIRRIPDPNNPNPQPPVQPAQEPQIDSDEIAELQEIRELRRIKKMLDSMPPDPALFTRQLDKMHSIEHVRTPPAQPEFPVAEHGRFVEPSHIEPEPQITKTTPIKPPESDTIVIKPKIPKPVADLEPLPDTGLPANFFEEGPPYTSRQTVNEYTPYPEQSQTLAGIHRPKTVRESPITLPVPEPTETTYRSFLLPVIGIVCGIGMLAFGIFNAGGFYETGSRLSGDLARFFYVFQIANLLEIIGIVCIWAYSKEMLYQWANRRKPKET